ncbi:MAG TPA: gamma-glutamyltransferase, partial [Erwinia persicina]|nr:gamma-glutamyltransferase [Erwinia persicina]
AASLKVEGRVAAELVATRRAVGHEVELLPDNSEVVGHAGATGRNVSGMGEGAFDPRSNGSAAGF